MSEPAAAPLVFPRDKSPRDLLPGPVPGVDFDLPGCSHALRGAVFLLGDGGGAPVPCGASNRCEHCARLSAFVCMTMLRQDAEEFDAPDHVLTLTSVRVVTDSSEYREWCRLFWRAFRKRYGRSVEYCGFVEWTTGEAATSGGRRRLHSHWLVKSRGARFDPLEAQAWASKYWRELSGAWRVELAELRTVGGVVGYLALHHEKLEQAPPAGWTGRRLRPSQGYFTRAGADRRARAEAWLRDYRARKAWAKAGHDPDDFDGYELGRAHLPGPRMVWRKSEAERQADELVREPGSMLWRTLTGERRGRMPDAPGNVWARRHTLELVDFLAIVEREHAGWRARYEWACFFARQDQRLRTGAPGKGGAAD